MCKLEKVLYVCETSALRYCVEWTYAFSRSRQPLRMNNIIRIEVPPSVVFGYRVDNTLEHIEE